MSPNSRPINLLTATALVTALLVVLSSCKREERTFTVLPVDAMATRAPPNTPLHAAGAIPAITTIEYPSPQPDDVESNADALAQGGWLFEAMNCAGCHAAHGGGGIGPALSDDAWIYGWEPAVIFDSIVHGRPNGMPAFGGRISDHQAWQLVGYVRSLSGLASPQAAPGRSEHLSGATPPNSIPRPTPRSSTLELQEMRRREESLFARLDWIDPESGQVRVPDSILQALARRRSLPTTPTTRTSTSAPSHPIAPAAPQK